MTSNFKILLDYPVGDRNDEVIQIIKKIESNIKKNDLGNIYIEGRKILEIILSDHYKDAETLNDQIQDYIRQHSVPSKVKNALFGIKQKGNDEVHSIKLSDKPYHIEKDIFSIIEFLKQIFIVIKYFSLLNLEGGLLKEYENEYKFNADVYFQKHMKLENMEEDLKPETQALETKLKGIFELIASDFSFLIPTYQREYTWTTNNIDIFLEDIKDRSKDKQVHYMGSLAISIDEDHKILRLIDGQQRITTSLLLIKVFYDRYLKLKQLEVPTELEKISNNISKKYINQAGEYGELNYVKKILSNNMTSNKNFIASTAYKNYIRIKEYIDQLSSDEFEEFYTTFVYYFVIAELRFKNNLGQEIQIFENLNSKGTELSQWDLIKNYIYKNIELSFLVKNEQEIEKELNKLFVLEASASFGKDKIKKLSEFFIVDSRIKHKLLHGSVLSDKGKIHKIFAKIWPNHNTKFDNLIDLEESLIQSSKYFKIYTELKIKKYNNPSSALFKLRLHLENTSIKDTHYPLIINAIYNSVEWEDLEIKKIKKENEEALFKLLSDIDKYITRLLVVNNIGQSLSQMFDSFIDNDIEKSHKLFLMKINEKGAAYSIPSLSNFKKAITEKYDWQKDYALSVLRTIENKFAMNKERSNKYEITLNPTLEHIFPRKPKIPKSEWFAQEQLSEGRFKLKHDIKVNKIGNYLILSLKINAKLSNGDFSKKKDFYKNNTSILFIGKPNVLLDLSIKDTFTFEDIDERTKQIANIATPLYKLSNE